MSASPAHWRRCSNNNTVVATVASTAYAPALLQLGSSASAVGFPCVLVQPMDAEHGLPTPVPASLLMLPVPEPALLPRRQWCEVQSHRYGHRRAQLFRVRLWRMVLDRGLDLLAVDAVLRFTASPLPHVHGFVSSAFGQPVEVLGAQPGYAGWGFSKAFRTTAIWLRSTERTRALLRHVENRTFGGVDQLVLSEELNFGPPFANVSCCHTPCLGAPPLDCPRGPTHLHATTAPGPRPRHLAAGGLFDPRPTKVDKGWSPPPLRCRDDAPPAAPPPLATRLRWTKPWRPDADNELAARFLRFGRCTAKARHPARAPRPRTLPCTHLHRPAFTPPRSSRFPPLATGELVRAGCESQGGGSPAVGELPAKAPPARPGPEAQRWRRRAGHCHGDRLETDTDARES